MPSCKSHDVRHRSRPFVAGLTGLLLVASVAGAQEAQDLRAMTLEDLLNMTVNVASRSDQKLSDAPGVITVISKDELKRFGGVTLKDILERVPSLIGTSVYMTDRSMIASRGDQILASGSHVLLLLNGRPVREALEGGIRSEILETFPVNVIEQIEVVRGPGSVLYGTDAFSAVINVITAKATRTGVSLLAQAGPDSQYRGTAKVAVKADDFSLVASGQYHQRSEWNVGYVYPNPDGSAGSTPITIPNKGPGAFVDLTYKGFRLTSSYNEWDNAYFLPIYQEVGLGNWKKDFVNAGLNVKASEIWDMDFNVTYARSRFDVSGFPFIERDSYTLVGEWTNSIRPNDKTRIVFGALYDHVSGNETFLGAGAPVDISDATRENFGSYVQVDYKLLENMNVIAGLQVSKVEGTDVGVVPRAGVIWRPAPRFHVKGFYSQAFRAPSINEVSLDHPVLKGNPDLEPEKVGPFDLSVGYQGERGQVTATYFLSKQSKLIVQNRSVEPGFYDNIGKVDFHGFELEGKLYATDTLFLSGSTLYFTSQDGDGVENVTPIASFGFKAGMSYATDSLTVSLFDIYQGDLDSKYEAQFGPSPSSYNRLNLHLRASFKRFIDMDDQRDLAFVGQLDNLFDEEVWLPAWGLGLGNSIPFIQGRSIYLGLELTI